MTADFKAMDFYPRPPRGGRHTRELWDSWNPKFLSTPSARRATQVTADIYTHLEQISIHALREEGDIPATFTPMSGSIFLSTPSARRATATRGKSRPAFPISIHALREEGDL